jgi:site-specific DNA recombinase
MDAPATLRPYLRISDANGGRSKSTEEQLAELQDDCDANAWSLGGAYADKGISASRYGTKIRGDFARLMADLRAGALDGQILGLWETSRGSRQAGEWVSLADALRDRHVLVWVHTNDRLYDPTKPRDRKDLLSDALDAEYESEKIRQRVLRTFSSELDRGTPHGDVAHGYGRIYDPRTRQLIEQRIVPDEAAIVTEVYRRLDAGHAIAAICREFAGRGVVSRIRTIVRDGEPVQVGGIPLSEQVIRDIATNPTYKGMRRGRRGDTKLYPGTWEPIVPADLWDRVNARLTDPSRKTHRDAQGKHLLSMFVRCASCAAPMTSSQRGGESWHLRCHANCGIQVNEALMDELATELMVGYLSRPDIVQDLTRDDGENPELKKVQTELAAVRKQLVDLAAGLADLSISVGMAAKAEPPLLAAEAKLEQRERDLTIPSRLAQFIGPEDEVRARLGAAPLSARREVARLVFSPGLLGEIRVGPDIRGAWCRHESHDRPKQTCTHRVLARLEFARD